jgi:hypothetical protein
MCVMIKSLKLYLIGISVVFVSAIGFSQDFGKEVYKKFGQTDSASLNSGAVLVLYKDNTFLNYGIFKDLVHQEVYVWYTYGNWKQESGGIVCQSVLGKHDQNVVEAIKTAYRKRLDYRLIDTYYEFVNEKYSYYSFVLKEENVIDTNKNIEYRDITADSIKN